MSKEVDCKIAESVEMNGFEKFSMEADEGVAAPVSEQNVYANFLASSPWPWLRYDEFKNFYLPAGPYTVVSPDRCYTLYMIAAQAINLQESFWECGVYKGGTAMILADVIASRNPADFIKLHLFDTFEGMPNTDPERDLHQRGDFDDTDLESVRRRVGHPTRAVFHKGLMPETFKGMEGEKISLAHIDVDIYKSILDCCEFIYPRLVAGGVMLFDDYGFSSCPGGKQAVDEFFSDKAETPLVLPNGQAVVYKQGFGLRAAARQLSYNIQRVVRRRVLKS